MATLIFDLDGTLLDCRARHYAAYCDALSELGREPIPEPEYWARRRSGEGTFRVVSGLPDDEAARFRVAWMNRIERRDYLAMDLAYGGVAPALSELSRRHRLVLLTLRRDPEALAWQLAKTQLDLYLSDIISPWGGIIPDRKVSLLSDWYPTGETWVIGDTEADIDLAADLGARCVSLINGVRGEDYLRARGATILLPSVAGLPPLLRPAPTTAKP
jgi:phosphoglycolate phosphatase-like HAD superfamily hydrolase